MISRAFLLDMAESGIADANAVYPHQDVGEKPAHADTRPEKTFVDLCPFRQLVKRQKPHHLAN